MKRLEGKVAIVTGGGSGIGASIALGLAREGADLLIAEVDLNAAEKVRGQIREAGGNCEAIRCDVSKLDDIRLMVRGTLDAFGKIDILVNNAGIFSYRPFLDKREDEVKKTFEVNLYGYYFCAQEVSKEMVKRRSGRIINIGSESGLRGWKGISDYAATKGGVIALTRALAAELGPLGINVNCVVPGLTKTPASDRTTPEMYEVVAKLNPLKRVGVPEDLVGPVIFFASSDSDYVTGATLPVDGGFVDVLSI